jgi:hypothetical protein
VSRVLASSQAAGTAYVSFDGHQDDDFKPYLYLTTDFGKTWKSLAGNIPDGMVTNVVAEHPRNPNLLFVGTEFGLFVTVDGGKNWALASGNLPRAPVDDIIVNARDNDLILATHGRSIIILDDISMLENLSASVLNSEAYFFPVRDATQFYEMRNLPDPGASEFSGPNPDYGALISYYLKNDPLKEEKPAPAKEKTDKAEEKQEPKKEPKIKIVILDKDGKVVKELEGPDKKGFNRTSWDLRYSLPFESKGEDGWFGPLKGHFVLPGEYTIKLQARNVELVQKFNVKMDSQARTTSEALQARFDAVVKVSEFQRAFKDAQKAGEQVFKEFNRLKDLVKEKKDASDEVRNKVDAFSKKLEEKKKAWGGGWDSPEFVIMDLAGQLQASTSAPTQAQLRSIQHLAIKLEKTIAELNEILTKEFPELQKFLESQGIKAVSAEPVKPPKKN